MPCLPTSRTTRSPHLSRVAAVIAACVVLAVASVPATGAPDRVTETRRQVERIERELGRLDAEAGRAAVAHNRALDRRDGARARAEQARRDLRDTRRSLTAARATLARRLVDLYVRPDLDPLMILLATGSVSDVAATADLLDLVARRDAQVLVQVRDRERVLQRTQVRLRDAVRVAEREYATAVQQRARVAALLAQQRERLAGSRQELRRAVRERRERLRRLAAQKRVRAAATTPGGARSAGRVLATPGTQPVFPIAGPSTFSDDWLAPRGSRYHEGIDLFAARGTPVVAVADGSLFRVGYSGISGYRLWLRDGNGTTYFYAHLDGYSTAAREGAYVRVGTVLGFNGDTGDARGTSPHVHFEIHPGGGGPIRPYPLVSAWPRIR